MDLKDIELNGAA